MHTSTISSYKNDCLNKGYFRLYNRSKGLIDTVNRLYATGDVLISSMSHRSMTKSSRKKPLPVDVIQLLKAPEVTWSGGYDEYEEQSVQEEGDAVVSSCRLLFSILPFHFFLNSSNFFQAV